jgi:hypothetical protein
VEKVRHPLETHLSCAQEKQGEEAEMRISAPQSINVSTWLSLRLERGARYHALHLLRRQIELEASGHLTLAVHTLSQRNRAGC